LQADIAAALIRHGVQVTVFNQRSVDEIFSMLYQVAAMVGEAQQGLDRIAVWRAELDAMRARVLALQARVRVAPGFISKSGTRRKSARSAGCPS
jgi:iron complex transport system substrate-binding protein